MDKDPIPPIKAFAVIATYACPELGTGSFDFKDLTAYAQLASGTVWVVAFDYPLAPITEADRMMLQAALRTITASR